MQSRIHISLEVSDLKKSVVFYEKLFSQKVSKLKEQYANFRVDEPALHLALVAKKSQDEENRIIVSNQHYGVELFSDSRLRNWQVRLESMNFELRLQSDVSCCYAKANKFWCCDPDGNEWEFWVKLGEADEFSEIESVDSQVVACCASKAVGSTAQGE